MRVTAQASAPRSAGISAAGGCNDVVCRPKLHFVVLGRYFYAVFLAFGAINKGLKEILNIYAIFS